MTTNSTIKSSDKIKLLDQMLEDLAGEELGEFDNGDADIDSELVRYAAHGQMSTLDNIQ